MPNTASIWRNRARCPIPTKPCFSSSSGQRNRMRIDILSLFPKITESALEESMMKRATAAGLVEFHSHNIRDWATDKHRTTDDTPYGGGQGMVMKCEPIFAAVEALRTRATRVVFMSPAGRKL